MKAASEDHSSAGPNRKRKPLPQDVVELTAQRLCVMAHPSRIALLEFLNDGEAGVQDLADAVGLTHQIASRHLAILHQAGMLSRRRLGAMTFYAVTDWSDRPFGVELAHFSAEHGDGFVVRRVDVNDLARWLHGVKGAFFASATGDSALRAERVSMHAEAERTSRCWPISTGPVGSSGISSPTRAL